MVAGESPEVLPEGWTVQLTALKTGRKVKCYFNPGTGQKFFSKDDLMRHIKARNTQLDWPQPTKSLTGSPSKNNPMHLIEYTNEHPEWLPNGWNVELKTRKSGSGSTKKYKCYVEPLTGCKFYSKPEVFRHLEIMGQKSYASKQTETFMSVVPMSEVSLRYPDAKVKFEKSTAEGLPAGWIKEIKIQRKASGLRKDPYYIDPVSGYAFRSKKDAQRYLETGDISTCKILPKKRDADDEILPSCAAKSQKLEHDTTRQQLFTSQGNSEGNVVASSEAYSIRERGGITASALATVPVAKMNGIHSQKIPSDNGAEPEKMSNANWLAPTKAEVSERNQVKNGNADGGHGLLFHQADKKQEQHHESGIERDKSDKSRSSLSVSTNKKGVRLPRRCSKRLAGIKPEMAPNSESIVKATSEADNKQELYYPGSGIRGFIVHGDSEADKKQEENSPESGIKGGEIYERNIQNSSSLSINKKAHNLHLCSTEQLTAIEPEPVANSVSIVQGLPKMIRSSKDGIILAVGAIKDGLADKTTEQIKDELKEELLLHTSTASTPLLGEPSNKSQKSDTTSPVQPEGNVSEKSQYGLLGEPSNKSQKSDTTSPVQPKGNVSEKNQYGIFSSDDGPVPKNNEHGMFSSDYSPVPKNNEHGMFSTDDGPVTTPEVDTIQEQKSINSRLKGREQGKTQKTLRTSRNKKAFNFPRRSSKRLAGLEPELIANSESDAQALQNTKRCCKGESIEVVGLTPDGSVGIASQQISGGPRLKVPNHTFTDVHNSLQREPLNKNQVFLHRQTVSRDQSQMLDANETNDEKSESKLIPPFGEFLSDPCLEFAFKTLTGEIPVEITTNNGTPSTPAPDVMEESNFLAQKMGKSSNEKTLIKSRKQRNSKKVQLPYQSPEFRSNSMASIFSGDRSVKNTPRKSSNTGAAIDVGLAPENLVIGASVSQQLKPAPVAQCANYHFADAKTMPSNNRIEHLDNCTAIEIEKNSGKPELPPFFSYGDCWSDPCFEFAFKTLTGTIPIEENFPVQSYFQQQVDTSQTQREGCFQQVVDSSHTPRDGSLSLPDFGLPSFFQTDISVHFDAQDKQLPAQPQVPSSNPSFMPSGNASMPNCSTIGSPKPAHLKENKGLRGKVSS